jgi:flagella basal body P-ring formation protein FlgA
MLTAHGEDLSQWKFAGAAQVTIRARTDPPSGIEPSDAGSRMKVVAVDAAAPATAAQSRLEAWRQGKVTGVAESKDAAQFSEAVRQSILAHLATHTGIGDGWRLSLNISDRQRASLAAATSALRCDGGSAPWIGKQRFVIAFETADGPAEVPMLVDVMLSQPIAVAARPIAKGAIVTAADVELQQVENAATATARRTPVRSIDELIGQQAGRAIQVGEAIYTDQVSAPVLVKRGETIDVIAQGGGIRVRTTARARQDGARGELIQVESSDTKERFDARVTGVKEATVLAPAASGDLTGGRMASGDGRDNPPREMEGFRRYRRSPSAGQQIEQRDATAFRETIPTETR